MLGRTDVERIIENVLADLNIRVSEVADPNVRIIELRHKSAVISTTHFTITSPKEQHGRD